MTRHELPRETINALRQEAAERAKHQPLNTAQFGELGLPLASVPIIEENGKFYVDVQPQGMSYTQLQAIEQMVIQRVIDRSEVGTWVRRKGSAEIQVWDGEEWFIIPDVLLVETGIVLEHENVMHPEELAFLKQALEERNDEMDRLRLRQLLAESYEEDDGDE